jgi:23S rRNA (cytosine1962-C5)-methyltransferase
MPENKNRKVILKPGREKSIQRYHPWVFSGALSSTEQGIMEGDIVDVYGSDNSFLASGHYQPSTIAVRIFTFKKQIIDEEFWREKFRHAIDLRKRLGFIDNKDLNVFRLVNAEGDGFPGLIVDYYGGTIVTQAHSAGMYSHLKMFIKILKELLGENIKAVESLSMNTAINSLSILNRARRQASLLTKGKTGF